MSAIADQNKMQVLFNEAIELPQEERIDYIVKTCPDEVMRLQLITLVSNHFEQAQDFMETPALLEATVDVGDQVGAYLLLDKLGSGGMANVFLAERCDGAHEKKVALKIVREQLLNKHMRETLKRERQLLSKLNHPSIANIYDGGTTSTGLPYYVMDFIEGENIAEYCLSRNLAPHDILRLFIKVCDAVSHAHRHFIIHRDIKPSNILVSGAGEVKLLDFGIATLVDEFDQGEEVREEKHVPLTVRYASPEQVRGESLSSASDVYSLGVLLYELLLRQSPYGELDNFSELVSKVGQFEPKLASEPSLNNYPPEKSRKSFRGDVDSILQKALQKTIEKRYSTVESLVADVQNYLLQKPLLSRKQSISYVSWKFICRHRGKLIATTLMLVILAATATFQQLRILSERDKAIVEKEKSEQVQQFLVNLFSVSDPGEARGEDIRAREILDQGLGLIRLSSGLDDLAKTELLTTMGVVYRELGLYETAQSLLEESIGKLKTTEETDLLLTALNEYGELLTNIAKYPEAKAIHEEALSLAKKRYGNVSSELAKSYYYLAQVSRRQAEFALALSYSEQALLISDNPELQADIYRNLGAVKFEENAFAQAMDYLNTALTMDKKLFGDFHPKTADDYSKLGLVSRDRGDLSQAIDYQQKALEINQKIKGEQHPSIAKDLNNIANIYTKQEDFENAILYLEKALSIYRASLGEIHDDTADSYNNLGLAYDLKGDNTRAIHYIRKALEIRQQSLGERHVDTAATHFNLGIIYLEEGLGSEAFTALQQAKKIFVERFNNAHPNIAMATSFLGVALAHKKDFVGATEYSNQALEEMLALVGEGNHYLAYVHDNFAEVYKQKNDSAAAKGQYQQAYRIRLAALGEGHPETKGNLRNIQKLESEAKSKH